MKKTNDDTVVETVINAAGLAEQIRQEPIQMVDNLLMDNHGKRLIPDGSTFREEVRASQLGSASGHSTYAKDVIDEVSPSATTHAEKEAWLEGSEPRRDIAEQRHEKEAQDWSSTKEVPHNSIDPKRRVISTSAKLGFVMGDTSVLADQLYRSGSPLWLGLLIGMSLALTVVMVGSQAGHEVAAELHRGLRGKKPEEAPVGVRTLYHSDDSQPTTLWMRMVYVASACMFLALVMLGIGNGDPKSLALGYGLLGAITVLGSLCAEAYATNEAADQLKAAAEGVASSGTNLQDFEQAEADSAKASVKAKLADTAARHTALSTSITVTTIANRLIDNPNIGGYVDSGHIPVPEAPPAPDTVSVGVPKGQSSPPRNRKRRSLSLQAKPSPKAPGSAESLPDPSSVSLNGHDPVGA